MGLFDNLKNTHITRKQLGNERDKRMNKYETSLESLNLFHIADMDLFQDGQIDVGHFARLFSNTTEFVSVEKTHSIVSAVPGTGGKVISTDEMLTITLKSPIMTDHSSITYLTDYSGMFAKIYTKNALQINIFENKAKRMVKEKVNIKGVCWPQKLLTNTTGEFVGVLVPASKGVQLTQSIFNGNLGIKKCFPNWNKTDLCVLAHTIIDTICRLHRLGVRFGCINPASIYIVSATEVYFVDVDNWQIEGYPTMSRNVTFTPPELLSTYKKPHLFTNDEENYQIALLTFMLMLPGKYPYAKKVKSSNEYDSISDMSFPFSIGGDMRRSADAERPSGAWQIIWDHLPYKMCNYFYNTFHINGKFSRPGYRLKDYEWLNVVDEFYEVLKNEKNIKSRALMPQTFRGDEKRVFEKCRICGQEHPTFYFLHSIRIKNEKINVWDMGYRVCLPCAIDQSSASFTCKSCGRIFYYTNRTKIMHEIGQLNFDWNKQKWCHDCKKQTIKCSRCGTDVPLYQIREFRDKRRNQAKSVCQNCFAILLDEEKRWREDIYITQVCRQCGCRYSITNGEAEFYNDKGFDMPSRCRSCRSRR